MQRFSMAVLAVTLSAVAATAQTPPAPSFVPVPDNAILSTNLNGLAVTDKAGTKVGTIRDEVIESGRLAGYILSVGGFLGIGDHHVVVAPAGLRVAYDANRHVWSAAIDATKAQLLAAPAFRYEGRWGK